VELVSNSSFPKNSAVQPEEGRLSRAAHIAMAIEAMDLALPASADGKRPPTDIDLHFELDEHGRVWMIREGDCHILGRRDSVRDEMWRFLRGLLLDDLSGEHK
jgi:hypothetical protein